MFAVVIVVREDWAVGGQFPGTVAHDFGTGAVGVIDVQVQEQFRKTELGGAGVDFAAVGVVTAIAENDAQRVRAAAQVAGDIVGHVKFALVILGERGRKFVVA